MHFSPGGHASHLTSVTCLHHSLLELERATEELDRTETEDEELLFSLQQIGSWYIVLPQDVVQMPSEQYSSRDSHSPSLQ